MANRLVNFRQSDDEIAATEEAAKRVPNRTVSSFIREAIREKIERERKADRAKANTK